MITLCGWFSIPPKAGESTIIRFIAAERHDEQNDLCVIPRMLCVGVVYLFFEYLIINARIMGLKCYFLNYYEF